MAYCVSLASLTAAVRHLCRYGDTDIFPHLPELTFFADKEEAVVAELGQLDLDNYAPAGAIEALAPKGRYSFRIAHQLQALDTVLLLACVVEIGKKIEARRQPIPTARAFSYRFSGDVRRGQVFREHRTYKDWLHKQQYLIENDREIKRIVSTDISDYYSRINFHRLENLLDEVAPNHGAARFIKKHVKIIRAKQSFGLPVGGSAARLLAELALADIDQALRDRGILATRFVDDIRILLKKSDDPYDALGYLAEQLGINEGLSLNAAKTSVVNRREYILRLERLTSDLEEEAEGVALDALTADLYFEDEPDQDDLERLKGLNLVEMLKNEIDKDNWDMGHIKVIFRALRIAKPKEAMGFIRDRFAELFVFGKEMCLLMEVLQDNSPKCFDDLLDNLIEAILTPPALSVQLIRTWLLEIFVRGIIDIPLIKLHKLESLPAAIDKRQLLLIRGRRGHKNYFRKQKTAIHHFSDVELSSLVWGASCLPKDEYKMWLRTLKASFSKPLGLLFLEWAALNQTKLYQKLKRAIADQPE
ncbi:MAG TPA: RNA-directed DNA polymerase [Methylocella sp.]|nr:RNA-directed DNA polymerase [Methylocella sp.]